MKILKIENGGGHYRITDDSQWKPIDEIDKGDLIKLVDVFLKSDVEMDDTEKNDLSNQAQQIIYRSIFEKLSNLGESKNKFKDEADRTYLASIDKYTK